MAFFDGHILYLGAEIVHFWWRITEPKTFPVDKTFISKH